MKRRAWRKEGFAFILALSFLVMMLALGVLLSRLAAWRLHVAAQRRNMAVAEKLAEAGAQKAIWQIQRAGSDYTGETFTLSTPEGIEVGEVVVQVAPDPDSHFANSLLITSWGYVPSQSNARASTRLRVRLHYTTQQSNWHTAFDYAVFTKGKQNYQGGGNPHTPIVNNGSVHSNTSISINNPSHRIAGPGYDVDAPNWPDYSGDIPFPLLDLDYYRSLAQSQGRYYNGTTNIQLPDDEDEVTFVEGLSSSQIIHITGHREGEGILIVVGGNLSLSGNVEFEGLIYVTVSDPSQWSPGEGGRLSLRGNVEVKGAVMALELQTASGTPRIYYDTSKIPTLRLDTSSSTQLTLDAWER